MNLGLVAGGELPVSGSCGLPSPAHIFHFPEHGLNLIQISLTKAQIILFFLIFRLPWEVVVAWKFSRLGWKDLEQPALGGSCPCPWWGELGLEDNPSDPFQPLSILEFPNSVCHPPVSTVNSL